MLYSRVRVENRKFIISSLFNALAKCRNSARENKDPIHDYKWSNIVILQYIFSRFVRVANT